MLFWKNKKVLITGHTGFKGSWLSLWLQKWGAEVIGFSLNPPTRPSLFELANVAGGMHSYNGDVRNYDLLKSVVEKHRPEILIHMAAQPLVRHSYRNPIETFEINVMGTVNVLEVVRNTDSVQVIINVTSDKCYENKEWVWGYRETDPMGGYDPYSASKGCAELITSSFRNSFFNASASGDRPRMLASVRAGNVIGGGDWAEDRLVPDMIRAILQREPVLVRNPQAIRPWQHVLDPLYGYLLLAENLWISGIEFGEGWNFGPSEQDAAPVSKLVEKVCALWGGDAKWTLDEKNHPHEANYLKLDCSKARMKLDWKPKLQFDDTIEWVVDWYKSYVAQADMQQVTLDQMNKYEQLLRGAGND
ncbi:CDP-glucose 4,6-dehydratase [Cohnella suwonensis]|uniref:CDP-glucose 4,6-dehydratase n=1 Tax=Cohnella suwonensis TaxID=696072 RepID=A0ABW0LWT2_9BACL